MRNFYKKLALELYKETILFYTGVVGTAIALVIIYLSIVFVSKTIYIESTSANVIGHQIETLR